GGVHINTMTGYRQQRPRIGLIKCPDLVDHYMSHYAVWDIFGQAMIKVRVQATFHIQTPLQSR
ncbi:hypothetical protein ACW5WG_21410, partial [Aeromonas salmonicida]